MKTITLKDGGQIPAIGFGTFGSDHYTHDQVANAVGVALRLGYRLMDCAQVYGNEALIGRVFNAAFNEGMLKREELFVTSKVWNDQHTPGKPTRALKASLHDLGLDYVDAYFVHWPFPNYHAPGCDGDSRNPDSKPFSRAEFMGVWRELEKAHDDGLIRHLGMSNMTISKLEQVLPKCRIMPSLIEMELHPSFQQQALFDYCMERGIQVIGYCPLGSPNRPARDRSPEDIADTELPEVMDVAKAHGVHPAAVCLKWASAIGAIPIPLSCNEKNIRSNLLAVNEDPLTSAELTLLKNAERGCRLVKGQVFLWPGAERWEELWD